MTRRTRWILALLTTFVVALVAFGSLGYWLLLPWIVRQQVVGVFRKAGLTNVSFDVRGSSLYQSNVANLSAGDRDLVKIGGIAVRYSPLRALRGQLDSITISDAKLLIDLDHPPALSASESAPTSRSGAEISLPFTQLDLINSSLVLNRGGRQLTLPLSGSIARASSDSSATLALNTTIGVAPLVVRGTVDPTSGGVELAAVAHDVDLAALLPLLPENIARSITSAAGNLNLDALYSRSSSKNGATLELALRNGSIDLTQELAAKASGIDASVAFDRLLALATPPGQSIVIPELTASGATIKNVRLRFHMNGLHELNIEELRGEFAGGEVRVEPMQIDLTKQVLSATIVADHVGIGETVAAITQGRGTGSGRFSGSLPIMIDFTRAGSGDAVTLGEGSFTAEPGGNLRLGEASTSFEKMLDESNPDLADPEFADVRQGIVEAVRDFDYDLLDAKFARQGDQDLIKLRLYGHGRTGHRVPINLGLNIQGGADLINDYLALKSRVFSTATTKGSP